MNRPLRLRRGCPRLWIPIAAAAVLAMAAAALVIWPWLRPATGRLARLRQYWADPSAHAAWAVRAGDRCGEAPFVLPTDGLIGFVWGDSFRPGHRHQGLDIFGPTGPDGLGQTPVVAAYDGYLTRLPEWRSAVILRVPRDPLDSSRQIWLYYAHMADADGRSFIAPAFPPGTSEVFVRAGTLLGRQGNYSADPDNPTGMHLHFSIVRDDGAGGFLSELEFDNTLDPSPYLGMVLNAAAMGDEPPTCPAP
jgi:murein DD-endopeptidase MepM/ murein hydrolase activator NlpD